MLEAALYNIIRYSLIQGLNSIQVLNCLADVLEQLAKEQADPLQANSMRYDSSQVRVLSNEIRAEMELENLPERDEFDRIEEDPTYNQ